MLGDWHLELFQGLDGHEIISMKDEQLCKKISIFSVKKTRSFLDQKRQ